MKKVLLTFAALSMSALALNAQTRLVLYEEFTGETCGPCAATNPGLQVLMDANSSNVQMIKYMSPIPSVGMFYYQDKPTTDARISYYSVPFAPYARTDGKVEDPSTGSPGHPGYLTQADLTTEAAIPSPFNITVAGVWSPNFDSATATITVKAVSAYAPTGTAKLRAALVETVHFTSEPGTNGEKDFETVVRAMYPDNTGTTVTSTWAAGDSMTYTISGAVPTYVDRNGSPFFVVWIQNDGDKSVAQAAKSPALTAPSFTVDAGIDSVFPASAITCTSNGNLSVILHNYGTTALTAANLYTGTFNTSTGKSVWIGGATPWTGTLAPGATTIVTIPNTLTVAGNRQFIDSVAVVGDENGGNNMGITTEWFQKPGNNLPISSNFDANTYLPSNWLAEVNPQGHSWVDVWSGSTSQNIGHWNSQFTMYWSNPSFGDGETGYLIMPTPNITGPAVLAFYVAYAQQDPSNNDMLEVVTSADCGTTWTSLWMAMGANLATGPVTTGQFLPNSSQWSTNAVDISEVPAGNILAFRATTNGGNFLFLDDVAMRAGTLGVTNAIANASNINIYPNPAKDNATLSITLSEATNVSVTVIDELGRVLSTVANQSMNSGMQKININTSNFASGVYNVKIQTGAGITTERLSVVK